MHEQRKNVLRFTLLPLRAIARAIKVLLDSEADAMIEDENGWLPLHHACSKDHVDRARLLLERFPNSLDSRTSMTTNSMAPLLIAASYGSVNCVELLLPHLADDQGAADKRKALHYGAQNGSARMLELLKDRGFTTNSPNVNGWLPSHWASASGRTECARTLCKWYRAQLDSKSSPNDEKRTALHLAVKNNHCNVVTTLLKCGADANEQMSNGSTALHLTVANNCVDCIEQLVATNAGITIRNNVGETALHIAAEVNSCNALRLLRRWQISRGTMNDKA